MRHGPALPSVSTAGPSAPTPHAWPPSSALHPRPQDSFTGMQPIFRAGALMSKIRLAKTHGVHSHSGPCWPGTHAVNSNHALSFPKAQPAS